MIKKIILALIILGLLLPGFAFSEQPPSIQAPETLEEAREIGERAGKEIKEKLPGILEQIWKEEVMPIWRGMWQWFNGVWNRHIGPRIEAIWQRIQELLGKEIEKRKPIIEEELEREKEELKKELPEVGKSLWQRFKELIK